MSFSIFMNKIHNPKMTTNRIQFFFIRNKAKTNDRWIDNEFDMLLKNGFPSSMKTDASWASDLGRRCFDFIPQLRSLKYNLKRKFRNASYCKFRDMSPVFIVNKPFLVLK